MDENIGNLWMQALSKDPSRPEAELLHIDNEMGLNRKALQLAGAHPVVGLSLSLEPRLPN